MILIHQITFADSYCIAKIWLRGLLLARFCLQLMKPKFPKVAFMKSNALHPKNDHNICMTSVMSISILPKSDQGLILPTIFFSDFWKFQLIFPIFQVVFLSIISGNNFQKSAQLAAPKTWIQFFKFFSEKIWGFKIFWLFSWNRKLSENVLGRIKPWNNKKFDSVFPYQDSGETYFFLETL